MKVKIDDKTTTYSDSAVTVEDFPGDTGEASGGMHGLYKFHAVIVNAYTL